MIYDNEMPMMILMFESCSTLNSCIAAYWVLCLYVWLEYKGHHCPSHFCVLVI